MGEVLNIIREKFPNDIILENDFRGDETVLMKLSVFMDLFSFLKTDSALDFNLLVDVCGVDYYGEDPRYEVVYHLYSITHNHRIRVRFKVSEELMIVPSVTSLWVAADWFEREVFDMYGIKFLNHPNLKKILTHESFEGYPLRKDYPVNRRTIVRPPVADILTRKPCKG